MKNLIVVLSMFMSIAHAGEAINDKFKFEGSCNDLVTTASKGKPEDSPYWNLATDLETANNIIKIVNDSKEDADFRYSVIGTGQSFWDLISLDLQNIASVDKAFAEKVIAACALKDLGTTLTFSNQIMDEINSSRDGIDSNAGEFIH